MTARDTRPGISPYETRITSYQRGRGYPRRPVPVRRTTTSNRLTPEQQRALAMMRTGPGNEQPYGLPKAFDPEQWFLDNFGQSGGGGITFSGGGGWFPSFDSQISPGIEKARAKALEDALKAIDAEYGMNLSELNMQQGDVRNFFRQQGKVLDEEERLARRGAVEDSAKRGIIGSSIHLRNEADVLKKAADMEAQLEREYGEGGTRLLRLQSAINLLAQQKEAARQQARTTSEMGALDLNSLLALIGSGVAGTNFAGQ